MEFKPMKLNYPAIPVLAICFSRSTDFAGNGIALVRGGIGAVCDKAYPCHAFVVTVDRGQKFATEETLKGLVENSLENYTTKKNRIVAMYTWDGWTKKDIEACLDELALIRRRHGESSKYDFGGLFIFVKEKLPKFLQWMIPAKINPESQWCSENVLYTVLDKHGFNSGWKKDRPPSPDELLGIVNNRQDCKCVLNYYLYEGVES